MQQPVALLEQGLKALAELVFVDVRELLQHLLHRGQFIPEPLRLQLMEQRPVVRLRRLPGSGALPLELLAALPRRRQLRAALDQLLAGNLELLLQLLHPGGTLALALQALLLQLFAAMLHHGDLRTAVCQLLTGGLQLMLQVTDTALALIAFLFQERAALAQPLQISLAAFNLLTRF